ncbi:MAG: chorismate-binding protein [Moraxellaceae bacterium]|nr:chorismate-binding protein [Moraxellaceae bacterium]
MIKTSLDCPFLSTISPTELVAFFSKNIAPVWLNNEGQNVIGILPKCQFILEPSNNQLKISQKQRNHLLPFSTLDHSSYNTLDNFIQQLIYYQNQQNTQIQFVHDKNYQNGFIGYISYDVMANDLVNEEQMITNYFQQNQPTAFFAHYDIYLTFQQKENKQENWQLHCTSDESQANIEQIYQWLQRQIISFQKEHFSQLKPLKLTPTWNKADYQNAFQKTQKHLYQGDCYQINLTQAWQGKLKNNQLSDYLPILHKKTNAPFASYLGLENFEILSCSPELFFTFNKINNKINITTKPIKGTRPRGTTPQEDEKLKSELANSEKDLAENVMIVDLLRNDLAKYSETGTVKVPKLFAIESFSNVHHMVSTVTSTLRKEVHSLQALFGSLPAGSITGAPKKSSVAIIHELESGARGAYCGTMGYLNFDGTGQWNVLIRTLQADKDGNISLWAGGGITVGSECEAEYQECLDKVGNILEILA